MGRSDVETYSIIGKSFPKPDSIDKVMGSAKYCADITLPGMLWGKILRSPLPHARILTIDTSKAERMIGVKAVITSKDTPKKMCGRYQDLIPELLDEYPIAIEKVRYVGDEVASVAAIDEDTAQEALELIHVEYEPLPAVFDPEEAMKDDAPKIHEPKDNISLRLFRYFGNVEQGFNEADHIFEDKFTTHGITHCAMETHAALALFDNAGRLTVWLTTQNPFPTRSQLARGLGLEESRIRVIKPHIGGGFGGKVEPLSLDFCASLLSMKTLRPVKICYTRDEVFCSTRQRHPMIIKLKTGVKNDGMLVAKDCTVIADTGAYNGLGPTVMAVNCSMLTALYRTTNIRYQGYLVYTNNPVCGALRGYGNPQIRFADDSQMDIIAHKLGIDPVELRIKNSVKAGDVTPNKLRIMSCGYIECLRKASELGRWGERRKGLRGIGIAGASMVSGAKTYFNKPFGSGARVEIQEDGSVILFAGGSDIGQGMETVLAQITAEQLGVKFEQVRVISGDTEITPWDTGTSSSRGTMFSGHAAKLAAMQAKEKIKRAAAALMEVDYQDLEIKDGWIYVKGSPDRGISFTQAVKKAMAMEKKAIFGYGYFDPDTEMPDEAGQGNVSPAYSFSAYVAEVDLDRDTGKVRVLSISAAHDCGFAINPMAVQGQIEGAISMGLGYAMGEGFYREKGVTLNPSFLDYKIPTCLDMPEIKTSLVQSLDPNGPFGAKEASEGIKVPVAPALANALWDAAGVRIKDLPITAEKILDAIEREVLH